jgi:hypothetical protein
MYGRVLTTLVYVNHKPAVEYSESELLAALSDAFEPGNEDDVTTSNTIKKTELETLLQLYGEAFTKAELDDSFGALCGGMKDMGKKEFIGDVLGLSGVEAEQVNSDGEGGELVDGE